MEAATAAPSAPVLVEPEAEMVAVPMAAVPLMADVWVVDLPAAVRRLLAALAGELEAKWVDP